jgi:hypothetical protein
MSLGTLSADGKAKLKYAIEEGLKTAQSIDDLKGSLRDTVKAIGEELNISPKSINGAIKCAIKNSIDEQKEGLDEVEEILVLVGRR